MKQFSLHRISLIASLVAFLTGGFLTPVNLAHSTPNSLGKPIPRRSSPGLKPVSAQAPIPLGFRRISSPEAGFSLNCPTDAKAHLVFRRTAPVHESEIVEQSRILTRSGAEVLIDVWQDQSTDDIIEWIDRHDAVLGVTKSIPETLTVSTESVPALRYRFTGESGQAHETSMTFFKRGSAVFRILCVQASPEAANLARQVQAGFSFTVDSEEVLELADENPNDQTSTVSGFQPSVYSCGGLSDTCNCGINNPFPCCSNGGNCTWYAWHKACCAWGIGVPARRDAKYWASDLRANGYPVSSTPSVNSIACSTSGTWGHVAWVLEVNGSQVRVSEMNCGGNYGVREKWYAASFFNGGFITPPMSIPSAPTITTLSANGPTSIAVSYSPVNGAAIYAIERATGSGAFQQIYCGPGMSYSDSGAHLSAGTTYCYRVRAGNRSASCYGGTSGWSGYSATRCVTTPRQVLNYTVEVSNVDDLSTCYVNGQSVGSVGYRGAQTYSIGNRLRQGWNPVRMVTENYTGGFTYGWEIRRDGQSVYRRVCGQAGSYSCGTNSSRVVFDETYWIYIP